MNLFRKYRVNYYFLLPALILVAVIMLYPLLFAIQLSTQHVRDGEVTRFVGAANYLELCQDKDFRASLVNTFVYMAIFFPLQIVIALLLAQMIASGVRAPGIFRTGFFLPCVVPMLLAAIVWVWIFDGMTGPLNQLIYWLRLDLAVKNILVALGSNPMVAMQWFIDKTTALFCNAVIGVWASLGFSILILLGGINSIPTEVEEAALLDGATGFRKFWHVTLPFIKDSLALVILTSIISSIKVFSQIYATTQGGPGDATLVLYYYFYRLAFTGSHELGKASAVAIVMAVIILILNYINFKYVRTRTGEE